MGYQTHYVRWKYHAEEDNILIILSKLHIQYVVSVGMLPAYHVFVTKMTEPLRVVEVVDIRIVAGR